MKQRLAVALGVGVFLVIGVGIVLGSFFHMHHGSGGNWAGHVFGGKITHISTTDFSVADIHGTQKTFQISPSTDVKKGKESVGVKALSLDAFVMVDTAPRSDGNEVAREVRLISAQTGPYRQDQTPQ